jgi:hypothetical protein
MSIVESLFCDTLLTLLDRSPGIPTTMAIDMEVDGMGNGGTNGAAYPDSQGGRTPQQPLTARHSCNLPDPARPLVHSQAVSGTALGWKRSNCTTKDAAATGSRVTWESRT